MTIPSGVGRIVVSGHMRGGDAFSFGWWATGANFATNAGCQTVAQSVVTSLLQGEVVNALGPMITPAAGYDKITVYGYPNGGPAAGAQGEAAVTGYSGSSTSMANANQISVVVTLLTGQPGRRHRGRMYLPADGQVLANGQLSDASAQNIALAARDLIRPASGSTQGPVVLSQMAGTHLPVTAVRVDSRVDIQRRRAAQEAIYFSETVPLAS